MTKNYIMNKWIFTVLLVLTALLAYRGLAQSKAGLEQQPLQHVVPLKKFPRDQRFETVSGDPTKAGAIYVIRIHSEAGFITMPHTHPEDEHIVVVKGSWSLAMGDRFNRQTLESMEPGTYGLVPGKMTHFRTGEN